MTSCAENKNLVYLIVDSMGSMYVGITSEKRFKNRMCAHSRSGRFSHPFVTEILYKSIDRKEVELMETFYVNSLDTHINGLNQTHNGKGAHRSAEFHTCGFKFSEESRKKMSETRKALIRDGKIKLPVKTEEQLKASAERIRERLKGTHNFDKVSIERIAEIREMYDARPDLGTEFPINDSTQKTFRTYEWAFYAEYAEKYGVSATSIRELVEMRSYTEKESQKKRKLSWDDVTRIRDDFSKKVKLSYEIVTACKKYTSYERAFAKKFESFYGLSAPTIFAIITRKGKYEIF